MRRKPPPKGKRKACGGRGKSGIIYGASEEIGYFQTVFVIVDVQEAFRGVVRDLS